VDENEELLKTLSMMSGTNDPEMKQALLSLAIFLLGLEPNEKIKIFLNELIKLILYIEGDNAENRNKYGANVGNVSVPMPLIYLIYGWLPMEVRELMIRGLLTSIKNNEITSITGRNILEIIETLKNKRFFSNGQSFSSAGNSATEQASADDFVQTKSNKRVTTISFLKSVSSLLKQVKTLYDSIVKFTKRVVFWLRQRGVLSLEGVKNRKQTTGGRETGGEISATTSGISNDANGVETKGNKTIDSIAQTGEIGSAKRSVGKRSSTDKGKNKNKDKDKDKDGKSPKTETKASPDENIASSGKKREDITKAMDEKGEKDEKGKKDEASKEEEITQDQKEKKTIGEQSADANAVETTDAPKIAGEPSNNIEKDQLDEEEDGLEDIFGDSKITEEGSGLNIDIEEALAQANQQLTDMATLLSALEEEQRRKREDELKQGDEDRLKSGEETGQKEGNELKRVAENRSEPEKETGQKEGNELKEESITPTGNEPNSPSNGPDSTDNKPNPADDEPNSPATGPTVTGGRLASLLKRDGGGGLGL
jgi:hypothetical protein